MATLNLVKALQEVDDGRLPGPRWPNDSDHVVFRCLEVKVLNQWLIPIAKANVFKLNLWYRLLCLGLVLNQGFVHLGSVQDCKDPFCRGHRLLNSAAEVGHLSNWLGELVGVLQKRLNVP